MFFGTERACFFSIRITTVLSSYLKIDGAYFRNPIDDRHKNSGRLQVADAPLARQSSAASGKPALWRRRVEPAPEIGTEG
jgi:hypothetical protein